MDLKKLRAFYVVGEHGSLQKAANYLRLTCPAISVQLKKLERELGVRLFNRQSNKLVLTEQGRVVLNEARHVFEALMAFKEAISVEPQMYSGKLTISLGTDLSKFFAPRIAAFSQNHPGLRITILSRPSAEALSSLLEGAVDVAIGWFPKVPRCIQKRPLLNSTMHLIIPNDHPLSRKKKLSLADIAGTRLILHRGRAAARRLIDSSFHKCGIQIDDILEVEICESIVEFVRLGLGIGFVHAICLPKQMNLIRSLNMKHEFGTIEISMIYRKSLTSQPSYQAFIDTLVNPTSVSIPAFIK